MCKSLKIGTTFQIFIKKLRFKSRFLQHFFKESRLGKKQMGQIIVVIRWPGSVIYWTVIVSTLVSCENKKTNKTKNPKGIISKV